MVRALAATAAALMVMAVSGCGPESKPAPHQTKVTHGPTAAPTKSAPAYLEDPKNGECHDLTLKDIAGSSDTKKPVDCSADHTTVTVAVVTAPDEARKGNTNARAYAVGQACGDGFKQVIGGDSKTRAKSLYTLAWFLPTKAQRAKGANWLRCDVTLSDQHRAYLIKGKLPLLDDGLKKRELRCGRNKPNHQEWEFVPCTTKHQYVARTFVEADAKTTYKQAAKAAEKACFAEQGLFSWSLPEQWGIGDRWYVCWETVDEDKASNNVVT
ncbi:MAG: septum formation family protein [Aeromicrobium sp.]